MEALWRTSMLDGGSSAWVEGLYETYLRNPNDVSPKWRDYFAILQRQPGGLIEDIPHDEIREHFRQLARRRTVPVSSEPVSGVSIEYERKQIRVFQLINAYRFRGHQLASLDPLERREPPKIPELTLRHHGLSEADFETEFDTGGLIAKKRATLAEIFHALKQVYCQSVGPEYRHVTETVERHWIRHRIESMQCKPDLEPEEKRSILNQLTAAEGLERYLHTKYVGQKRFSLEGGESLIPVLAEVIERGGSHGVKEIVIGMAHRGRLNVLVNIMGKTPAELFMEFEGKKALDVGSGDVKYHMGFSSDVTTSGGAMHLALAFNPSHLEIVGPVVEGSVRARQERRGDREGCEVIPVQIHGDAAFSGQGVVMETLQMSQSRGFSTKGTVHIVVNNQIGFTTSNLQDARSTLYSTDVVKMVNAPVFHVNADDLEAVIFITRLALDYRMEFRKDVVIDLVCYRRHGHNEADEPSATQPQMYQKIRSLETTRALYAKRLEEEGVISAGEADEMVASYRGELDAGHCVVPNILDRGDVENPYSVSWTPYLGKACSLAVDTNISLQKLRELAAALDQMPEGFELHPRVAKIKMDRYKMAAGALPLDWGFAETMAYASLVDHSYDVRLTGQDAGRGTFFHRHAVWHNQLKDEAYVPLRNISETQGSFLVIDSLLSEEAVLAFEYGYSAAAPDTLVIWEAQFGDFANGAQVVIDQFISAAEPKWGRLSGLVLLLPHGFEGQGPEHSSARLERFLQLCVEDNMQVCMPTTPAQIFHLLRRQMMRDCRRPLVIMSPKSLLRHNLAVSSLEDLTGGQFQQLIPEIDDIAPGGVKRVILCSGKVYYDLLQQRRSEERDDVAILRVEQLYPFPREEIKSQLARYKSAHEIVWCQEEPKNMGAWDFCEPRLNAFLTSRWRLSYAGRAPSASPAVGSAIVHASQQKALVAEALASVS